MVALKHLKRSNMFRSIFRSSSGSSYCSLLKTLIKTVKSQIFGDVAAASPKIWLFTVLISAFNKEQHELPEDDLKMDRNMFELFKCFIATILD
jgi:hypothetical protein